MFENDNANALQMNGGASSMELWQNEVVWQQAFSSCLVLVFLRMFAALVVTAIVALFVTVYEPLKEVVLGNQTVFLALLIGEILLVIGISFGINKIPVQLASILFYTYAIVNGLTLSVIFFVYEINSIYLAFGITALMFAVLAAYGVLTKKDLSTVGSICMMGLFGIIIASLANFFFRSDMMDFVISFIGVFIFVGLTAYDTQRIKKMLYSTTGMDQTEAIKKISIMGALTLYLDFINLFLKILKLLGKKK